jgi:hypothetical protein
MVSTYAIAELAVKLLRWALCAADVADRLRDGRLARDKKAMTQHRHDTADGKPKPAPMPAWAVAPSRLMRSRASNDREFYWSLESMIRKSGNRFSLS